jgi:hypothetical protein
VEVTTLRLVLALGCRHELVTRTRRAVPARTLVRESSFVDFAARILRWRPLAIVVPIELYALDARTLDTVAARAKSTVVPVPRDDVPADALRCVIAHAIANTMALRQA